MTDFELKYLNYISKNENFILEGNREYWEMLVFTDNKIFISFGDTMENRETGRTMLSDEQALFRIKKYYLEKNDYYDIDPDSLTLEQVFDKINLNFKFD